jgi:hypothetical protein
VHPPARASARPAPDERSRGRRERRDRPGRARARDRTPSRPLSTVHPVRTPCRVPSTRPSTTGPLRRRDGAPRAPARRPRLRDGPCPAPPGDPGSRFETDRLFVLAQSSGGVAQREEHVAQRVVRGGLRGAQGESGLPCRRGVGEKARRVQRVGEIGLVLVDAGGAPRSVTQAVEPLVALSGREVQEALKGQRSRFRDRSSGRDRDGGAPLHGRRWRSAS